MRDRVSQCDALPKAFEIGIVPAQRGAYWLRPFDGLSDYLTEKSDLLDNDFDLVFADVGGTDDAQSQILNLVSSHLLHQFPEIYHLTESGIAVSAGDTPIQVSLNTGEPPLVTASKLVADDLVLMRKKVGGWQLASGCVCFPSVWNMRQKIGKIMSDVHAPVPGFSEGTRKAKIIERMFDHMQTGITVERRNWSIHAVDDLHLPYQKEGDFVEIDDLARIFLRGEVQTLTKLDSGSDILFTIGVYVDPLEAIKHTPSVIADLNAQLMALDAEQLNYKGLRAVRDRLHGHLNSMC